MLNNEVIPELNKVPGINSLSVGGLTEETLQITVDKEKALRFGLSLEQIKEQINQKQLSFPAGSVNDKDLLIPIRVEEKVEVIKELNNIVLQSQFSANPQGVKLSEIATIEETNK